MSNYDVFIFGGHGDGDCGAIGSKITEQPHVKEITKRVVSKLESIGLKVLTNANNENNYNSNLTCGHTIKYKCGCTIHENSASDNRANGSEIIVPLNEKFFDSDLQILTGLCNLGFTSRGLKSREYNSELFVKYGSGGTDYYKEIREAWVNGLSLSIIELGFISHEGDQNRLIDNVENIANLIASVYANQCDAVFKPTSSTQSVSNDVKIYRVQVGAFRDKQNAERLAVELNEKGYKTVIA